ncbi:MAG: hypothetical protein K2P81_13525 [Bacteriovoracaceae bacterium]|nr:hypothetical protein [Bacteriovoracaceae bacterium]
MAFGQNQTPQSSEEIIKQSQAQQQFENCESSFTNNSGLTLNTLKGVLGNCKFRPIDAQDVIWNQLPGINTTKSFQKNLEAQRKAAQEMIERKNRDDEVVITDNIIRFDQVRPEVFQSAGFALGQEATSLSHSVTEIMLYLERSDSLEEFAKKPKKKMGPGIEALAELSFLSSLVDGKNINCAQNMSFEKLPANSNEATAILWDVKGKNYSNNTESALQMFLGFQSKSDIEKVDAYRWKDKDGIFHYLFRSKGNGEDRWVLANYDVKTGRMKLRNFRIVSREMIAKIHSDRTIGFSPLGFSTRSDGEGYSTELSGAIGFELNTYNESLPWGGEIMLPTKSVNLSQIKLIHATNQMYSSHEIDISNDRVDLTSNMAPIQNSNWQANFHAGVKTDSGEWRTGTSVRVENLMMGIDRSNGGKNYVSFGVVGDDSYAKIETDGRSANRIIAGKSLSNTRKAALVFKADLDKRAYQVQVVVFLD